ncbi:MAG: hypothetical protein PVG11_10590 [Anaerolineae bacterium]|jgi:hypothetical protein
MLNIAVSIVCFLAGLVMIWQGVQRWQGKRGARPDAMTRMTMSSMSEEEQDKTLKVHATTNKVQAAMRVAFGLFVIGTGVYLLLI